METERTLVYAIVIDIIIGLLGALSGALLGSELFSSFAPQFYYLWIAPFTGVAGALTFLLVAKLIPLPDLGS